MITKRKDLNSSVREELKGGVGFAQILNITDVKGLNNKGRIFSLMTLSPGHSIGSHVHIGESEIYFIIEGQAQVTDNGVIKQMEVGDSMVTGPNEEHSILNVGENDLKFIALIVHE